FLLAYQVGYGAALEAPSNQVAIALTNFRSRLFAEAGAIQVDPVTADGMSQEHFGIQAREFRPFLGQVLCRPLEQPSERPFLLRAHDESFGKQNHAVRFDN